MCQEGRAECLQRRHRDSSVLLDRAGHLLLTDSRSQWGSHRTLRPLHSKKKTLHNILKPAFTLKIMVLVGDAFAGNEMRVPVVFEYVPSGQTTGDAEPKGQ